MEKVKLTKEQADALEWVKQKATLKQVLKVVIDVEDKFVMPETKILNNLSVEDLARSWFGDFEVVLTPLQKFKEMYEYEKAHEIRFSNEGLHEEAESCAIAVQILQEVNKVLELGLDLN